MWQKRTDLANLGALFRLADALAARECFGDRFIRLSVRVRQLLHPGERPRDLVTVDEDATDLGCNQEVFVE